MTALDLKKMIASLPDDLPIRYKYDSGFSYPLLNYGYIARVPSIGDEEIAFILDTEPRDNEDTPE